MKLRRCTQRGVPAVELEPEPQPAAIPECPVLVEGTFPLTLAELLKMARSTVGAFEALLTDHFALLMVLRQTGVEDWPARKALFYEAAAREAAQDCAFIHAAMDVAADAVEWGEMAVVVRQGEC